MPTSTPDRIPSTTPPAAPKAHTRKPSAKVLEAQQSLRTRTVTRRSAQTKEHTIAVQATQQTACPTTQPAVLQATQHELSPFPMAVRPGLPEHGARDNGSNKLGWLIASFT